MLHVCFTATVVDKKAAIDRDLVETHSPGSLAPTCAADNTNRTPNHVDNDNGHKKQKLRWTCLSYVLGASSTKTTLGLVDWVQKKQNSPPGYIL